MEKEKVSWSEGRRRGCEGKTRKNGVRREYVGGVVGWWTREGWSQRRE